MKSGVDRFVVISGCSGGGKSTLLVELAARGHAVVEEPGRRLLRQELESGGSALPWVDAPAFLRRALAMGFDDRGAAADQTGWVFFDRGLVDAASALQYLTGEPALAAIASHRYHATVFLTPPWPEIYVMDAERRHGFDKAVAEYARLQAAYPALGYQISTLPKVSVKERADFVLGALG